MNNRQVEESGAEVSVVKRGEPRARLFSLRWWNLGRNWRLWGHVTSAFAIGTGMSWIGQGFVVVALFGVPALAVLPVLGAAVLFGLAGACFQGEKSGLRWSATALVWIPGFIAAFALSAVVHPGGYDPSAWWTGLLAGVLPALVTALGYPGPSRAVALSLLVFAAIAGTSFAIIEGHKQAVADAKVRFGSTVRPFVTTVAGYRAPPDAATALGPVRVTVAYYPKHPNKSGQFLTEFYLVTESGTTHACGGNFAWVDNGIETSCVHAGNVWERRNNRAHEVADVVDGHLIRAVGPISTPESVLRAALLHASPMTDGQYNATLFPTN